VLISAFVGTRNSTKLVMRLDHMFSPFLSLISTSHGTLRPQTVVTKANPTHGHVQSCQPCATLLHLFGGKQRSALTKGLLLYPHSTDSAYSVTQQAPHQHQSPPHTRIAKARALLSKFKHHSQHPSAEETVGTSIPRGGATFYSRGYRMTRTVAVHD
jgi:hypothetical protein